MRSLIKLIIVFTLFTFSQTFSQQLSLKGKVFDAYSNEPLIYANVRIQNTFTGTASNKEGVFEIKLNKGTYNLVISYIGYRSDTVNVNLENNKNVVVELFPISVNLPEITVLPKENPANEIIRRAIAAKHARDKKLNSYIFDAYTKGLVKTTSDFSTTSNRDINLSLGGDTANLKITGMIENESKGYFKKPDYYKDEIIAQKQTANMPPTINILTGGRLIQNFYTDDVRFFSRPLSSPIADNALDYYYFNLKDTLAMDDKTVFKISFETIDKNDPGFYGTIYITDKTFALIKLDVNLNKAANPGTIFSKVNILQQFQSYADSIYMPIDYRLFIEGNVYGLAKFGLELNSIFYNYQINQPIPDDVFGMVVIKVQPDADKRDSTYWKNMQTIPNTKEELEAYQRIDSLESIPKTFWDDFSPFSTRINFNDNFSISGPLSMYHFNKIEGHSIDFGLSLNNVLNKRSSSTLDMSYAFSDKKFKFDFSTRYMFGDYRTGTISLNVFNKLTGLFEKSIEYEKFTSSVLSLLTKYDFRDYYYTKGFDFAISDDIFPVLKLGLGFMNRTDNTAFNNTNFSFFNKSKTYSVNTSIYDAKINALTLSYTIDFRKFIEDGYHRRKIWFGNPYITFSGDVQLGSKQLLKSDLDFQTYSLNIYTFLNTFKSARMRINLDAFYSTGSVPFQMMYALPGNIESSGKNFSFRTLRISEVFGDKVISFNIEHNFNDELFRLLGIPFLKDNQFTTSLHFNAALSSISDKSKNILPHSFTEFKHPFYEIGFGIGHVMIPLRLEFTWKLNYRGKNDFVIGINTFML